MVTVNQLIELKKRAEEAKNKAMQAQGTKVEIEAQISELEKELKELGIKDLNNANIEIEKLKEKIETLYEEAKEKLDKFL